MYMGIGAEVVMCGAMQGAGLDDLLTAFQSHVFVILRSGDVGEAGKGGTRMTSNYGQWRQIACL